jgi:hypothetical protein
MSGKAKTAKASPLVARSAPPEKTKYKPICDAKA